MYPKKFINITVFNYFCVCLHEQTCTVKYILVINTFYLRNIVQKSIHNFTVFKIREGPQPLSVPSASHYYASTKLGVHGSHTVHTCVFVHEKNKYKISGKMDNVLPFILPWFIGIVSSARLNLIARPELFVVLFIMILAVDLIRRVHQLLEEITVRLFQHLERLLSRCHGEIMQMTHGVALIN